MYVMVDIGYKSEGQISVVEFKDEEGKISVKVGDEVDVLLESHEDENGEIVLSKEKAAKIKVWDDISDVYKAEGVIEGRIVSKVKGGLSVDIGVQAFLPGSQVDLRPVRNHAGYFWRKKERHSKLILWRNWKRVKSLRVL